MKVVINACYGGFSLSPRAVKRLAELNGRECYFFTFQRNPLDFDIRIPATVEELELENDRIGMWSAFDIPNPNEVIGKAFRGKDEFNERYKKHSLPNDGGVERNDPKLIQVIEELGAGHRTGASGPCADLRIVEIPDGTDYEIQEYDGLEHVAERHRTWS
jgi:hypothetical protein